MLKIYDCVQESILIHGKLEIADFFMTNCGLPILNIDRRNCFAIAQLEVLA
jgi:hypothetical protein